MSQLSVSNKFVSTPTCSKLLQTLGKSVSGRFSQNDKHPQTASCEIATVSPGSPVSVSRVVEIVGILSDTLPSVVRLMRASLLAVPLSKTAFESSPKLFEYG